MKIGILGTGAVGKTIGTRLVALGHEVKMGSRTAANEKAMEWVKTSGKNASTGTFADAASFGEIVFNCTKGEVALDALRLVGKENLKNKILIDVSNPLDFSKGFPPSLTVCNTDSMGEMIQREFPETKVVKSLNTMNCAIMLDPAKVAGDHSVFVSGNDKDAKEQVKKFLESCGWKGSNIYDLGDITSSRGVEQLLPFWVRMYGAFGHANFNFNIVK
ncbi:MAG TPA: NAD(P)-binding domain-containing protein [Bacteroidia bacterium]|jgi:predicted dinucleotide-binding enzyme|nr:NAD(P)-binding domain-containing protein [Bacteroidia bacterium]